MTIITDKDVLLFYKDFEKDTFFKHDRYLKRVVRPAYNLITQKQKMTGFYAWYQLLIKALREAGYNVHLNDYALARKHPDHPVGLVGYPHLLDAWNLPNPAVLGPCLFDHPQQAPNLMHDPRYKRYITTCDWMYRLFAKMYGDQCVQWYAGMALDGWPDTRTHSKDIDVLIYDKIRWNREHYEQALLNPIIDFLSERGLQHMTVRYKFYDQSIYRSLLSRTKSMIFLCEHETQGIAYQEALTCNVPILAWENGFWLDPMHEELDCQPISATSVPFFSPECGEKFTNFTEFPAMFETFWATLERYQPRQYVERELSLAGSAHIYVQHYYAIAEDTL